jgi:hypothetical protein
MPLGMELSVRASLVVPLAIELGVRASSLVVPLGIELGIRASSLIVPFGVEHKG